MLKKCRPGLASWVGLRWNMPAGLAGCPLPLEPGAFAGAGPSWRAGASCHAFRTSTAAACAGLGGTGAWRDRGGQDKTKGKAAIPTLSTSAVGVTSPRAALGSAFDMRLITSECGCLLGMCCREHRWGFAPTCSARSTCSAINQLLRVPLDSSFKKS